MNDKRKLANRYELGDLIGRGGMAEVFEAVDTRLNRTVAIKILRDDLARDPAFIARFRREAQAAAALNHPTIVAVYDTGEEIEGEGRSATNVPYIVMEYVNGTTLRDIVKSGRKLQTERALRISIGVLDALAYSHSHGIIHRDIKPANVMITKNGDVKVMDFGIARALADTKATMTGSTVLGTAHYLSPEQARGESVDARSDLYSAGVLLYELLTGEPPFSGDSPVSVAYQHVSEYAAPPSSLDSQIPNEIDTVVLHALAKSPDDRYQTAEEFQSDVERVLQGIPTAASVAPKPKKMSPNTKFTRTKPRGNSVLVMLAIAGIFVGGLTVWLATQIFGLSTGDRITVPSLDGLTLEKATVLLIEEGLVLGEVSPENSERPIDTIINQIPQAGNSILAGRSVDVVVSAGKSKVVVPKLIGVQSVEDARRILSDKGLKLGPIIEVESDSDKGVVISSDPAAGSAVSAGTEVSLSISSGLKIVPQVVGLSEAQARTDLANLGFQVQILQQVVTEQIGSVLAQAPKPGTKSSEGALITITVGVPPDTEIIIPPPPPEIPTPTPTVTVTVSPTPSETSSPTP
ncbi:MAG: Stk1 family PASTA domain-containing Ser/Thr kinase [Actinomycetota bacterium]|nr:Stk1 family PASTA domain-containing Ser/Thr kinase [Actinomycetota bacterium]